MFKCVIGLFRLPHEIASEYEVGVELRDEASLTDVIMALHQKIPRLDGLVVRAGGEPRL